MKLSLKSVSWKIAKAGIIMGTVGVLLAVVAPLIAMAIPGMLDTAVSTYAEAAKALAPGISPAWTGLFFGAFGAIHAAVDPIENWLFHKSETVAEKLHLKQPALTPSLSIALEPEQECTKHRDLLARQAALMQEPSHLR